MVIEPNLLYEFSFFSGGKERRGGCGGWIVGVGPFPLWALIKHMVGIDSLLLYLGEGSEELCCLFHGHVLCPFVVFCFFCSVENYLWVLVFHGEDWWEWERCRAHLSKWANDGHCQAFESTGTFCPCLIIFFIFLLSLFSFGEFNFLSIVIITA